MTNLFIILGFIIIFLVVVFLILRHKKKVEYLQKLSANYKEPKKTFRPDGTLSHEMVELPDGTKVNITYDRTGTKVLKKEEIQPYTEKVSKDGKCISRYRKDGTLWLVRQCDEKGEWKATEYDETGKRPVCTVLNQSH